MAKGRPDGALTGSFLFLVRSGLHAVPVSGPELEGICRLTPEDWSGVLVLAREQTVIGLIQSAVELLPQDLPLPQEVELTLLAEAVRIERRSASVRSLAFGLTDRLKAAGLHPILLKGPAVACCYPAPDRRQSGDIDIYLPAAEFADGASLLGAGEPAPDGSMHATLGEVEIDMHRRYYDLSVPEDKLPPPGSSEGVLLMLSAHIFKHACGAGVGLRQCCDYARARQALACDASALAGWYKEAGLSRWAALLDSFTDTYLGVPGDFCSAPAVSPEPLLRLVLDSGDFGTAGSSGLPPLAVLHS